MFASLCFSLALSIKHHQLRTFVTAKPIPTCSFSSDRSNPAGRITPALASMPVPYRIIPVARSGSSWSTPFMSVPRDSISSEPSPEENDNDDRGLQYALTIDG
jgi:hypothetical protein